MTPAVILLVQGLAAALAYLFMVRAAPSLGRSLLKTMALGQVWCALYVMGAGALPLLALALSVAGDLALSRDGDRWFLAGLGAFLLAHVVYAAIFVGLFDPSGLRWLMVAAIAVLALSTPVWLLPHTGAMRLPVAAYIATISAMGMLAAGLPPGHALVVWGALLFIASDGFLSLNLFVAPERAVFAYLVWPLYVVGQILIQFGLIGVGPGALF